MKRIRALKICLFVFSLYLLTSCEKSTEAVNAGLEGQVFANKGPAGHVVHATITTVQALNASTKTVVAEAKTDTTGVFRIMLPSGSYYLAVKESYTQVLTGPYQVQANKFSTAEAFCETLSF